MEWCVGMEVVGGSRRPLPNCTAPLSTKVSVQTGLSRSIILGPLRHGLVPAKLCVSLPRNCRTRVHPHDKLTLGRKVALLGAPNAVSTSCQKRVNVVLIGLSSRPFAIGSNRHVYRVIVTTRDRIS